MYTISLNNIDMKQLNLVGGKAANLGEMIQAGFPVPKGFVITRDSYDKYMEYNGFDKLMKGINDKHNDKKINIDKLTNLIKSGDLPEYIAALINEKYHSMGDNMRVAVRSSATAEDLPEASFAGQQDTYLNIKGFTKLIEAIKNCFASLWTERAVIYREETGYGNEDLSMAVVVQEMVEADAAGVMFTANPMNGNEEEIVINASYGLGETVVSGLVTPDTFIWDKGTNEVSKKILGEKEFSIIYDSSNGTVKEMNNKLMQSNFSITDKDIRTLTDIGNCIQLHYGHPMDIEWAKRDDKLYILQARQITAGGPSPQEGPFNLEQMMKEMMLEFYPEPPYPLELAPISTVFNIFSKNLQDMGIFIDKNPVRINESGVIEFILDPPAEPDTEGAVRPDAKDVTDATDVKDAINVKDTTDVTDDHTLDFIGNTAHTQQVFRQVKAQLKQVENTDIKSLTLEELIQQIKDLMVYVKDTVTVRMIYNIDPSMQIGEFMNDTLKAYHLDLDENDLLVDLNYMTWDMNVALKDLTQLICSNRLLLEDILQIDPVQDLELKLSEVCSKYEDFDDSFHNIMDSYGWKSTNSHQSFSASSWNEDKAPLLAVLKASLNHADEKDLLNGKVSLNSNSRINEIYNEIRATLPLEEAELVLEKISEYRTYHQNREESLYLLENCYGLCRLFLREVVSRYPNTFSCYSDILFLTMKEIFHLDILINEPSLSEIISARRQSVPINQKMWHDMKKASDNETDEVITGVSGGAGKVCGKACIIHDISEFYKLEKDDILICPNTDPVWTPLFAIAKAVVADTGAALSHAAIIAREYGIPAVMGCKKATELLHDGQLIVVDGNKGIVSLLSEDTELSYA